MTILGLLKKYWVNLIIIFIGIIGGILSVGGALPGCTLFQNQNQNRKFEKIWIPDLTTTCNAVLNFTKVVSESPSKDASKISVLTGPMNSCLEAEKRAEIRIDRKDCVLEVWSKGTVDWFNLAQKDHYSNCIKDKVK